MTILFISPLISATGNLSTAQRIKAYFPDNFFSLKSFCDIVPQNSTVCFRNKLNQYIRQHKFDHLIILHAYKCGLLLICSCGNNCNQVDIKYSIIFGGTDLNQDTKEHNKLCLITNIIRNSDKCVAFTNDLQRICKDIVPTANTFVQPQGILANQLQITFKVKKNTKLFLLISGIRVIKDPIFVINPFRKLVATLAGHHQLKLLILGPILEKEYFQNFIEILQQCSNNTTENFENVNEIERWLDNDNEDCIRYSKSLPHNELMQLLQCGLTYCVLNSSLSEGMCVSILEAMSCGVPVVARNIPGNSEVIQDFSNGILFNDEVEFVDKITKLLNDNAIINIIVTNAKKSVADNFSMEREKKFYLKHFFSV